MRIAIASGVGVVAVLASCASHPKGFSNQFGDNLTGDSGVTAGDASVGSFGNVTGDGGASCASHCSGDLNSFVDCNGNVIRTCPSGQGCAPGGQCVEACDAAKANKSSVGCDYYAVNPDTTFAAGACYAAFVANTWGSPVTLSVDYQGQSLDPSTFGAIPSGSGQALTYAPLVNAQLPAGQIAILFLAQTGPAAQYRPTCPAGITPALASDPAPHDTGIGAAFHITASAPVVAYDIFPYGGGVSAITSATLLLPTTAWDTNYVAVDAYGPDQGPSVGTWPFVDVIAAQDGTTVTIAPTVAIVGGTGVAPTGAGQPATYSLSQGQVLHLAQPAELGGSPVQSNNPVGLIGGNRCFQVPDSMAACDAAHQQIAPVKALGYEYVASSYRARWPGETETPPWRMVGAVAGTTLTYDPSPPAGAPTTLTVGQIVDFQAQAGFVVRSQDASHPFFFSTYMTGATNVGNGADNEQDGRGDPEFVTLVPPQQWLDTYVLFTDPTYPETNLSVVRGKAPDGTFRDVTLDCAGTVVGWQNVGKGDYQIASVDLVTGNFERVGSCDNGRHVMKSTAAFGVTVWGWGSAATGGNSDPTFPQNGGLYSQYVSYGYPAGASFQAINQVVVPPVAQ